MSLSTNTTRISGRYYFRSRVPSDLSHHISKTEIKIALATACPRLARKRSCYIQLHVHKFFEMVRQQGNSILANDYLKEAQNKIKELTQGIETQKFDALIKEAEDAISNTENTISTAKAVAGLLSSSGHVLKKYKDSKDIQSTIQAMQNQMTDMQKGLMSEDGRNLFSVEFEKFFVEKKKAIGGKFQSDYQNSCDYLISFCGDKQVIDYRQSDIKGFAKFLSTVPLNFKSKYKTDVVLEAVERNANAKYPVNTLSISTINGKYLSPIRSFFRALKSSQIIAHNPCEDINLKGGATSREETKARLPFSIEELNKLFRAPVYIGGVRNSRHWHTKGNYKIRDSRYWTPLIGLFTGARLNEIGQLLIADIVDHNEMKHFRFTNCISDEELEELGLTQADIKQRRIKTDAGNRFVPIHPTLIELGFLDYVEDQKDRIGDASHRIFEKCWAIGADNTYSSIFSKKFTRFLQKVGIKTSQNCFHSFRHTFKDAMRSAELSSEIQDGIMGHSDGTVQSRYGSGDLLFEQSKRISDIQYKDLDLSHLYEKNIK